jgi:hypothetical protein
MTVQSVAPEAHLRASLLNLTATMRLPWRSLTLVVALGLATTDAAAGTNEQGCYDPVDRSDTERSE